MADNTTLKIGAGGDVIRSNDRSGVKTQVVQLDLGTDAAEAMLDQTTLPFAVLLPVASRKVRLTGSFSRPNDANAYAAGDEINTSTSAPTAWTISGFGRANGGSGSIIRLSLVEDNAEATAGLFRLWLFTADVTHGNDNAAIAITDAQMLTCVGYVDLNEYATGLAAVTGNRIYASGPIDLPYVCAAASTSLWFVLECRNAFTPTANTLFSLIAICQQD